MFRIILIINCFYIKLNNFYLCEVAVQYIIMLYVLAMRLMSGFDLDIDPYNLAMRRCFWFLRPLSRPSWSSCRACRSGRSLRSCRFNFSTHPLCIFHFRRFPHFVVFGNSGESYIAQPFTRLSFSQLFIQENVFLCNQNLSNPSFTVKSRFISKSNYIIWTDHLGLILQNGNLSFTICKMQKCYVTEKGEKGEKAWKVCWIKSPCKPGRSNWYPPYINHFRRRLIFFSK